jgi:hypothetical protein
MLNARLHETGSERPTKLMGMTKRRRKTRKMKTLF